MNRAFTLIELLVVIVIIAVTAAILFPIFADAGTKARHMACSSNLRQLGVAFAMYRSDFDGLYPTSNKGRAKITGAPPVPKGAGKGNWHTALQSYLKNYYVLRCPMDRSSGPADPKKPNLANEYVSSYTVNGWSEYTLAQSAIARPEWWILLGERNNVARGPKDGLLFYWWTWQGNSPLVWPPIASPNPTPQASEDLALERHKAKSHWLYADGHVKAATFDSLWKPGADNPFWPHPPEN